MYFAILWKHPQISLTELAILEPVFHPSTKKWIVLFNTDTPELLKTLWWCIKSWIVVPEKALQEILKDVKIIWIKDQTIGKHFKQTIGIRRFKLVDISHTDKEIKEKGKEIINLDNGQYWVVENYQDIPLYEAIDFDKPSRSMQMGMMPAKLTHILINLGIIGINDRDNSWIISTDDIIIYDPFAWSGTTNFLANNLWYNTIWSDINISHAEKNLERRKTNKLSNKTQSISFFKHDITTSVNAINNITKTWNTIIVTEWRLWPIVTKQSSEEQIRKAKAQVESLYNNFLKATFQSNIKTIVFTIPRYIWQDNDLDTKLEKISTQSWYKRRSIDELYQREWQQIARKICFITK